MSTITTQDGTHIYFKDWGSKNTQPIVFHHGWPLSSDDWDNQMLFFVANGYRVVAHDRRGHGRSSEVPSVCSIIRSKSTPPRSCSSYLTIDDFLCVTVGGGDTPGFLLQFLDHAGVDTPGPQFLDAALATQEGSPRASFSISAEGTSSSLPTSSWCSGFIDTFQSVTTRPERRALGARG
jgi:pimeloyl-ACP methyl ester carboxylesterase